MSKLKLTLACWDYDRTRPLIDGRVQAEGIDLEIKVMRPRETFPRMLENREFEVSELSLGSYVSLKGRGICRFVAVPVALSKIFYWNRKEFERDGGTLVKFVSRYVADPATARWLAAYDNPPEFLEYDWAPNQP